MSEACSPVLLRPRVVKMQNCTIELCRMMSELKWRETFLPILSRMIMLVRRPIRKHHHPD